MKTDLEIFKEKLLKTTSYSKVAARSKNKVSIGNIKKYFSGRYVKDEKKLIIVKAAKELIREKEKQQRELEKALKL